MSATNRSASLALAFSLAASLLWACGANNAGANDDKALTAQAQSLLQKTGVQGGLIVHLGCGDGRLSTAFYQQPSFLVYGLDRDGAKVSQARQYAASAGKSGVVSFDTLRSNQLPLIDNTVNLLIAENSDTVPLTEIMRVLVPNGVAYIKDGSDWKKHVKPQPKEYDDWSHYLHGPDGHAMSKDSTIGPPMHLQWTADPDHAKSHAFMPTLSVMVSAGGRLFGILDDGPRALPASTPNHWVLFARDAFNGIVLWERPIPSWQPSHVQDRNSVPVDLHRRLVAADKEIYCTVGIFAPVSALDAATGATLRTYPGTENAEEIILDKGVLYVVVNTADSKAIDRRGMAYLHVEPQAKRIMAFRAEQGDLLWTKSDADTFGLMPQTLSAKKQRLFYQNAKDVVCLDAGDGKLVWQSARPSNYMRPGWSSPSFMVIDDVVISADRQEGPGQKAGKVKFASGGFSTGDLVVFSASDGKRLWSAPCAEGGRTQTEVFSTGGRVWYGQYLERNKPDYRCVRDLMTGEVLENRPESGVWPMQHHHRCYQDKATEQYILAGRTGIEFIDLKTGDILPHNWVRGGCHFGILPANGLIYAPPDQCGCYIESRLAGFNALAPKRLSNTSPAEPVERLVKGPAYGDAATATSHSAESGDWPTLRGNAARSGVTRTSVPAEVKPVWQTDLHGRLTPPVVAQGRLFVASIDDQTLWIIDVATGKTLKSFVAGGRIDSPPTVIGGLAVFGCRDGWVYAVRATDGELAWRFRAAPSEAKLVAKGRVESVWPVHGSVLVQEGCVYCSAGRSSYLDGGMTLVKLDLATGQLLLEKNYYSRDPQTGKAIALYPPYLAHTDKKLASMEMPGVQPDVISSDGNRLWMRAVTYDTQWNICKNEFPDHLFSSMGFLDDSWWELSYWIYGPHFYSSRSGIDHAKGISPAARIMVVDDSRIYGYRDETFSRTRAVGLVAMKKGPLAKLEIEDKATASRKDEATLDQASLKKKLKEYKERKKKKKDETVQDNAFKNQKGKAQKGGKNKKSEDDEDKKPENVPPASAFDWRINIPLYPQGLVLADKTLFVAGPPRFDEKNANKLLKHISTDDQVLPPVLQDAADSIAGKKGGLVCAINAADGKKLTELSIQGIPVFDGLVAAGGRLYLSLNNGTVICLGPAQ